MAGNEHRQDLDMLPRILCIPDAFQDFMDFSADIEIAIIVIELIPSFSPGLDIIAKGINVRQDEVQMLARGRTVADINGPDPVFLC